MGRKSVLVKGEISLGRLSAVAAAVHSAWTIGTHTWFFAGRSRCDTRYVFHQRGKKRIGQCGYPETSAKPRWSLIIKDHMRTCTSAGPFGLVVWLLACHKPSLVRTESSRKSRSTITGRHNDSLAGLGWRPVYLARSLFVYRAQVGGTSLIAGMLLPGIAVLCRLGFLGGGDEVAVVSDIRVGVREVRQP